MSRALMTPRSHVPTSTSDDYLFLLRMDETSAASNLTDEVGVRTMTQTSSPAVYPSATGDDATYGARDFDGAADYAGRAAADGDENIFQEGRGWGFAAWVRVDALPAGEQTIVELGEYSSPETEATNVQMRASVISDGSFRLSWEESSSATNRNNSTAANTVTIGEWIHLGCSMRPDPDRIGKVQIDFFVNGEAVSRVTNRPWPTGGSSSRWIVGASRALGSAVGTPGSFLNGQLDDVVITKWPPDVAWFRYVYGKGVLDFYPRDSVDSVTRYFGLHARVLVQVPTSQFTKLAKTDLEWIDLTNVDGIDFVRDVVWGASVEDFVAGAMVKLSPRYGSYNLSPFVPDRSGVNDNPLAHTTTVGATPVPLLRSMRRIRIETAYAPVGMSRVDVDPWWEVQFDGFIRAVDVTDDVVSVTAADLGVALLDVFIEPSKDGTDRQYGDAAGTAVEGELQAIIDDNAPNRFDIVAALDGSPDGIDDSGGGGAIVATLWSNTYPSDKAGRGRPHALVTGDPIRISGTTNYNRDDTIASVSSTQITTTGVLGGTAAEQSGVVTGPLSLAYVGVGVPELYVPTSPGWNVYEWNEPATKGVLTAIDDIASAIGWRVRYRWHSVRQEFRLTLFDPTTSYGHRDYADILAVNRMSTNVEAMRDVIIGEVADEAASDAVGEREIVASAAIDSTKVRTYGRRMARIRVAGDSMINTTAEMDDLVAIVLGDLKNPLSETEFAILYDSQIELQDETSMFYELAALPIVPTMFGEIHTGAAIAFEHRIAKDTIRTVVRMRNVAEGTSIIASISRIEKHAERFSQRGVTKGRGLSPPKKPNTPNARSLGNLDGNRMAVITWAMPTGSLNQAWLLTEVHASTTSGFTPDASTLYEVAQSTSAVIRVTSASTTYYVKIVHRDRMRNRSEPSDEKSFTSAA